MKKILFRSVILVCSVALCHSVSAAIDPDAPSASHHLEEAASGIHEYLHHNYGDSYGSHALEERSSELHGVLHDWQHGEATEADVDMQMKEVKSAWNNFRQTIMPAGLLNAGDYALEELYEEVKDSYKDVRFLLRKAK